jgi:predicted DNA-binding WGR domain protein
MTAAVLYRIDPEKRMQCYYRMDVAPDLFGHWCLMREWDRIGSTGQMRSLPFPTRRKPPSLDKQRHVKERRGYTPFCHV